MAKTFSLVDWHLANDDGNIGTWEKVQVAVLMDIRRELQTLNRVLACPNFLGIPQTLRSIEQNTKRPRRRRVAKKA